MIQRVVQMIVAIAIGTGCGGRKPAPPPPQNSVTAPPDAPPADAPETRDEFGLRKMAELADQMCGCADKACADQVQEAVNQWSAEVAKEHEQAPPADRQKTPDEAQMKQMVELGERYAECMSTAMGATP